MTTMSNMNDPEDINVKAASTGTTGSWIATYVRLVRSKVRRPPEAVTQVVTGVTGHGSSAMS